MNLSTNKKAFFCPAVNLQRRHPGFERHECAQAKVERIPSEEFERQNIGIEELEQRRKANPLKLKIDLRLTQETMMTWERIAQRLMIAASR
jgi:hypothetical protein